MKKFVVRVGLIAMIMSLCFAGSAFANTYTQAIPVENTPFGQTGTATFGKLTDSETIQWYKFNAASVNALQNVLVVPPSGQTIGYAIYDAALYTPGSTVGHVLSRVNVSAPDFSSFVSQAGHSYLLFIYGAPSGSNEFMIVLYYET
ncbi:hypothetical protein [Cohnella abietis]|uniref:Uncharacterized protein n=1 Tax=Cohnella abietis TaxID=2507935 RepID=A0A3T1D926_9BACL|nr:hypothetical protein [Cohnella abietis]BBI34602.1 hypothetical protein KCTCHS21_40010 [Cohnella abietis]